MSWASVTSKVAPPSAPTAASSSAAKPSSSSSSAAQPRPQPTPASSSSSAQPVAPLPPGHLEAERLRALEKIQQKMEADRAREAEVRAAESKASSARTHLEPDEDQLTLNDHVAAMGGGGGGKKKASVPNAPAKTSQPSNEWSVAGGSQKQKGASSVKKVVVDKEQQRRDAEIAAQRRAEKARAEAEAEREASRALEAQKKTNRFDTERLKLYLADVDELYGNDESVRLRMIADHVGEQFSRLHVPDERGDGQDSSSSSSSSSSTPYPLNLIPKEGVALLLAALGKVSLSAKSVFLVDLVPYLAKGALPGSRLAREEVVSVQILILLLVRGTVGILPPCAEVLGKSLTSPAQQSILSWTILQGVPADPAGALAAWRIALLPLLAHKRLPAAELVIDIMRVVELITHTDGAARKIKAAQKDLITPAGLHVILECASRLDAPLMRKIMEESTTRNSPTDALSSEYHLTSRILAALPFLVGVSVFLTPTSPTAYLATLLPLTVHPAALLSSQVCHYVLVGFSRGQGTFQAFLKEFPLWIPESTRVFARAATSGFADKTLQSYLRSSPFRKGLTEAHYTCQLLLTGKHRPNQELAGKLAKAGRSKPERKDLEDCLLSIENTFEATRPGSHWLWVLAVLVVVLCVALAMLGKSGPIPVEHWKAKALALASEASRVASDFSAVVVDKFQQLTAKPQQ